MGKTESADVMIPVLGLVMEGNDQFRPLGNLHRIGRKEHGLTRNTLVLLVSVDRPTRGTRLVQVLGIFQNLGHFPVRLIIIGFCAIEIQNHRLALGRMHGDLHPGQHEIPIRSPAQALVGKGFVRENFEQHAGQPAGSRRGADFIDVPRRVLARGQPRTIRLFLESRPTLALHALPAQGNPDRLVLVGSMSFSFGNQPLFKGSGHIRLVSPRGGLLGLL